VEDKTGSRSKETGRVEGNGQARSSKEGSKSPKEAKPPSVAPGGVLGSRALVFFFEW
jgi:hypothetical protein